MLGASSTNGARGRAVRRLCAPAAGVTKKVMNVSACLAGASTGRRVAAGLKSSACTPQAPSNGTTSHKGGRGDGPVGRGGPQAQRVHARAPVERHIQHQGGGPAAVVDVVAVEVDGA